MAKSMFLNHDYVERARYEADKKYRAWIDKMNYKNADENYPNTPEGHLVGMLGQFGAMVYLQHIGENPTANFLLPQEHLPDIFIESRGLAVEVKCWNNKWFNKWGRAISQKQYDFFVQKNVVLWTSVDIDDYPRKNGVVCYIQGWNTIPEFDKHKSHIEVWNEKAKKTLHSWQIDNSVMRDASAFL